MGPTAPKNRTEFLTVTTLSSAVRELCETITEAHPLLTRELTMTRLASVLVLAAAAACSDDPLACPIATTADAGDLPAAAAQRCNVPGSMGAQNWYRLNADLPAPADPMEDAIMVQVELWPNKGPFAGDTPQPGTYQLAGDDLDPALCGVCVRALAAKGEPIARQYFATAGTVEITAVAPDAATPFVATVTGATFREVDDELVPIANGCTTEVARVKMSGALEVKGGGGGMGGTGGNGCPTTVGQ